MPLWRYEIFKSFRESEMDRINRGQKVQMNFLKLSCVLTQRGSIMMITLIMILLATIIGFIAIKTSTTGISMAGNYRTGMQAFYTADSVSKYVIANPTSFNITNFPSSLSNLSITDPGLPSSSPLSSLFPSSATHLSSTVTYLQTGLPPAGTSSRYFQTNYFNVQTTVLGTNNAQETQQVLYASTVPKVCGQSC
jgi:type IV pilus assembly PilX-like protein